MRRERLVGLDHVAGTGSEHEPGDELARDVGAERGGERHHLLGPAGRELDGHPQRGGGVGRAAAHPGRDRDPLVDVDPHRRRVPAALPQGGERASDEVLALDPRADDLVRGHRRRRFQRLEHELVGERQRLEQGHELVAAVVPRRTEEQARG